jgi:hypothetical protein
VIRKDSSNYFSPKKRGFIKFSESTKKGRKFELFDSIKKDMLVIKGGYIKNLQLFATYTE